MEKKQLSIQGLSIIYDFISNQEEKELLVFLPNSSINKSQSRIVQRYGSDRPYNNAIVSSEIPDYLDKFAIRLHQQKLVANKPDSVSINEYHIGKVIVPHIDSPESGEIISILSLMSSATMLFEKNRDRINIELPPRSLVQLQGESRYQWKHSIEPVKAKRYSIVFRCSLN